MSDGVHSTHVMQIAGRWLLGICWSLHSMFGQQGDVLLAVKQRVMRDLTKLPDYVCTETIEQARSRVDGCSAADCKPEDINRIRLDVGYLKGKQIFGWPGGESLSEFDVSRLVPGLVTDGDVLAFARLLLLSKPLIAEQRQDNHNGRRAVRYDYRVALEDSGWVLRRGPEQFRVGYGGYFRVDANSLDVIEVVMAAENLPRDQDVQAIDRTVQYSRARIGSRDLLLPDRAVLQMTDLSGLKIRTETRFNNCRQYTAESSLHFPSEIQPALTAPKTSRVNVPLPDDFIVELALETEIDSDHAAIGDPITAKLERDVGKPLGISIGTDSFLHGRINRLEVFDGQLRVDIVFEYVELNGDKIYIRSRQNRLVSKSKFGWMSEPIRGTGRRIQLQRGQRLFFRSTAMYGH